MATMMTGRRLRRFHEEACQLDWLELYTFIEEYCKRRFIYQDAEHSMWSKSVQHPEWDRFERI